MRISYELALMLKEKLHMPITSSELTEEQLLLKTELEIQGLENLEGIENLKNLKKISVFSYSYSLLTWDVDVTFNQYINRIKDYSFLNKLTQLEYLLISNELYLEVLDVSNLKNLKVLMIINNPRLKEIVGLDQLKNLEKVVMYGNHINQKFDMKQYLENTKLVAQNIIDIDYYIQAVNNDISVAPMISNAFLRGETNILFAEPSGLLEYTTTHPIQLEEMYKKLLSYFKKENVFMLNRADKIRFVYHYILNNIKFNYKELKERNEKYKKTHPNHIENLKTNFTFLHNGYTTYHMKSGNCEGRVNLMHFMLEMLGIRSQNVHCIDRRANSISPNHAIIRIDKEHRYIDPSYQQSTQTNIYDYYMKDCWELEDTHILNIYERILYEERLSKQEGRTDNEKHFKRTLR